MSAAPPLGLAWALRPSVTSPALLPSLFPLLLHSSGSYALTWTLLFWIRAVLGDAQGTLCILGSNPSQLCPYTLSLTRCTIELALTWIFNLLPSRVRVRYQKRQKLQFETKLGMNSPF